MIYVLDFDGVICDSQNELAMSSWKAAQLLWPDMVGIAFAPTILKQYHELRPVVETGYEVVLIMRLLQQSFTPQALRNDYTNTLGQLLDSENLPTDTLKTALAEAREQWIESDRDDWLQYNPLYSGVKESLDRLAQQTWYIATTKQERLVTLILKHNQINIPSERIFGLDRKRPKEDILLELITKHPQDPFIFIEDRLPTLERISRIDALQDIKLQLADWGYNTQDERQSTKNTRVGCIGIEHFIEQ